MEEEPSICFFEPSPSMEEFLSNDMNEHFYQPSFDMDFIVHGISSIPFYERIELPKELLSEKEIAQMDKEAREFQESYRLKCLEREKVELKDPPLKKSKPLVTDKETDFSKDDFNEDFLKYFYRNKEIPKYEDLNKSSDPAPSEISNLLKGSRSVEKRNQKFEQFFKDLDDGLYDSVIVSKRFPLSSEPEEEEEDSEITKEASKLSAKIKFPSAASSYSRVIDEIFRETDAYVPDEKIRVAEVKDFPFSSDEEERKEKIKSKKENKNKRSNNNVQSLVDSKTKKILVNKATQYEEMPTSGSGLALKVTSSAGELSKINTNTQKSEVSEKVLKVSSDSALKISSISVASHSSLPKKDTQIAPVTSQKKVTPGVSKLTDTLKSAPVGTVSTSKSVPSLKKGKTKEGKVSDKKGNSDEEDWESMAVKSLISKQSKIKKSSSKKS